MGKHKKWFSGGLGRKSSDHIEFLLKANSINWGPKPFRVFNLWLRNEDFLKLVKAEWVNMSAQETNFHDKIKKSEKFY